MAELVQYPDRRGAGITARIYLLLFPIPIVCFAGAMITDIAYSTSAFLMWLHFSQWLIAAGLLFGALAAIVLLIEFFTDSTIRRTKFGWAHLVAFFAALVVELFNAFVHTIDGWTAVVPDGMTLSALGTLLALAAVGLLLLVPATWNEIRETRT